MNSWNKKIGLGIVIVLLLVVPTIYTRLFEADMQRVTNDTQLSEEDMAQRDADFKAGCEGVGGVVSTITTPVAGTVMVCDKDFGEPADYYYDNDTGKLTPQKP